MVLNNKLQKFTQKQISYREAMKKAAENKVEIKPLLKTLESRLVFAKCKPFNLDIPGRVFIFGKLIYGFYQLSGLKVIYVFSWRLNKN